MSDAVARGSMIFQRGEGRGARSEERGEGRGACWRRPAFQLLRTTHANTSPRPHYRYGTGTGHTKHRLALRSHRSMD